MKKGIRSLLCIIFGVALFLGGCASNAKLPDGFDQKTVETTVKQVIDDLNNEEYEALYNMFNEQMSSVVTPEMMKTDIGPTIAEKGKFVEYVSEQYGSAKDSKTGKVYAVGVIACKYENGSVTYTISIDSDGKVGGLYLK